MRYCDACGEKIPDTATFCRACGIKLEETAQINQRQSSDDKCVAGSSVGKNCPFCQTPIKPGNNTIACPKCKIVHHQDCWIANGNHCTTFGCDGTTNHPSNRLIIESPGSLPIENTNCSRSDTNTIVYASNNKKLIFLALIGVLIVIMGFSLRTSIFGTETDKTSKTSGNGSQTTPNSPASTNSAIAVIDAHVFTKDKIDKTISEIAMRFNQKLNNSRGQFTDPQLKREIQEVQKTLYQARNELQRLSVPVTARPAKQLLLELYSLEIIRINAIAEGLKSVERGGDYLTVLKPGTDAAYKYDDVNEDFSKSYANLFRNLKP